MSTLIVKRLSALPVGTAVQLSYGFMEGQNLMLTGTITDRDNSCMEIRDEQGAFSFVDYSAVKFFSVLSGNTQKSQNRKPVLLGESVTHFSQRISDYDLKKLFGDLDRTEKQLLQPAFDSFCYGVKCNSGEKRAAAAQSARKILSAELEKGYGWSKAALELTARMLSRENIHDWKLYDLAEIHDQAALCAFKENQWIPAGTQAAKALEEKNLPEGMDRDMMIVLEKACIALDDASLPEWLHRKGVDVRVLAEDLVLYKEQAPEQELGKTLEMLSRLYSRRELISAVEQVEKPAEPVQLTGMITKILWANDTGEITLFDGEEERHHSFRYSNVADGALLEQILREKSGFVQRKSLVQFVLRNGEAVQIRRGPDLLEQVNREIAARQYERACWYCRNGLDGEQGAGAMALLVEAAVERGDPDLGVRTLEFVEANREAYPNYSKAISMLAQLYYLVHRLPESLKLTAEALKDPTASARLRAGMLTQYCNYAMGLYNETGDESCLFPLPGLADQWLNLFHEGYEADLSFQKKHSRVLRWKIRGLLAKNQLEEAERTYEELVRCFPNDPKVKTVSDLIAQTRQNLLDREREQAPATVRTEPEQVMPAEEPEEEEEDFQVPVISMGTWEDLGTDQETFARRVFSMEGADRLAAQLTALRAGAMLHSGLKKLADTVAAAANDPLAENGDDTETVVGLLSDCDERFPVLNRYAVAAVYLRTVFGNDDAPLWLRRSIPVEEIPGLAEVCDGLEQFRRETGRCADCYAAYRDSANAAEQREKADLMDHARNLYNAYMAAPARDNGGRKFARFVETKELVHRGLKQYLTWVLAEDRESLMGACETYRKQFLATDRGRISGEKVDEYIISHWEQAGKHYPAGDGADLQGSRRNALRSSVRSILGVINDYYRWLERGQVQIRNGEGSTRFAQMKPAICDAMEALADSCRCRSEAADAEEKTGLFLLETAARELLDKISGKWQAGQERYLYAGLLNTNLVELGEDFLPDFTGLLTGPLGLVERVFAHDAAEKLEPGQHIARIFDRAYPSHRNFDTAELIRRFGQMNGREVEMPQPDRYIMQARLVAKLEFGELREALAASKDAAQEKLLLWLYDRCVRTNRFGYLTEAMEQIRARLAEGKEMAA